MANTVRGNTIIRRERPLQSVTIQGDTHIVKYDEENQKFDKDSINLEAVLVGVKTKAKYTWTKIIKREGRQDEGVQILSTDTTNKVTIPITETDATSFLIEVTVTSKDIPDELFAIWDIAVFKFDLADVAGKVEEEINNKIDFRTIKEITSVAGNLGVSLEAQDWENFVVYDTENGKLDKIKHDSDLRLLYKYLIPVYENIRILINNRFQYYISEFNNAEIHIKSSDWVKENKSFKLDPSTRYIALGIAYKTDVNIKPENASESELVLIQSTAGSNKIMSNILSTGDGINLRVEEIDKESKKLKQDLKASGIDIDANTIYLYAGNGKGRFKVDSDNFKLNENGLEINADKINIGGISSVRELGEWKNGTTYYNRDRVRYKGSFWLANKQTKQEPVENSEDWLKETDNASDIRIGGRNLLLNSKRPREDKTYNISTWKSTRDFVVGEELTVSIWGKIADNRKFGIWFNWDAYFGSTLQKVKEGLYTATFKVPQGTSSRNVGVYLIDNQSGTENWSFEKIKLESGNIATDWTPAPEDEGLVRPNLFTNSEFDNNGEGWGMLDAKTEMYNGFNSVRKISTIDWQPIGQLIQPVNSEYFPKGSYTLSFDLKVIKGSAGVLYHLRNKENETIRGEWINQSMHGESKMEFTFENDIDNVAYIYIAWSEQGDRDYIVSRPKLEYGDYTTKWERSKKDIEQQIKFSLGQENLIHNEKVLNDGWIDGSDGYSIGGLPDVHDDIFYPCVGNENFVFQLYNKDYDNISVGGSGFLFFYDGNKNFIRAFRTHTGKTPTITRVTSPDNARFYRYSLTSRYLAVSLHRGDNPKGLSSAFTLTKDKIVLNSDLMILNGRNVKLDENSNLRVRNGYFEGEIQATSGSFTGKIDALSGTIGGVKQKDGSITGGWKIDSNKIFKETVWGSLEINGEDNNAPKIVLDSKEATKYGGYSDNIPPTKITLDSYYGTITTKSKINNRTSIISSEGIFTNGGNVEFLPLSTGVSQNFKAGIASLGFGKANTDEFGKGALIGVYGNAYNSGNAPEYGGWFEKLRANGFYGGVKNINSTYQATKTDFIIFSNENKFVVIDAPENPYDGQILIIIANNYSEFRTNSNNFKINNWQIHIFIYNKMFNFWHNGYLFK